MDAAEILDSRRYLSHIGVWPGPSRLDAERWLENFDDADQEIALALLDSHVHINEEQIAYAVASTFRSLSSMPQFGSARQRQTNWSTFLNEVLVSFPLSFAGDVTASGYVFARIAERLGLLESQILDSERLVRRLSSGEVRPVVFLDDLAASGTQFTRGWSRRYSTDNGRLSLKDLHDRGAITAAYYLPVVATEVAKRKIEEDSPVEVCPTYLLGDDYSALDADSRVTPARLRPLASAFLAKYCDRTGRGEYGPAGYDELALSISFHHGCPNNTLPVLQWGPQSDTWRPLVL